MKKLLLVVLLLTACNFDDTPFPEKCREYGVAVQDTDTVTGIITKETQADDTRVLCMKPFDPTNKGCAISVNVGEYHIVYNSPADKIHEQCHALYEEFRHEKGRV